MLRKASFVLSFVVSLWAQNIYRNPVIDGDFPDPSVIRTDKKAAAPYWAVTTGGQKNSGAFPLFQSEDLAHWTRSQTGFVFSEPPAWTAKAYWAPEISEYRGVFYVFYSAVCDMTNPICVSKAGSSKNPHCLGVATAANPGGPYTDAGEPILCEEWGSIDPMVLWEQNKHYLIWKEDDNACHCGIASRIWAQQFSLTQSLPPKVTLLGEKKLLLESDNRSWEDAVVEGPFLLKHSGFYYLFYSGALYGGVGSCNYALGVARGSTALGPYVKDPANPILSDNASWKCPGHGSIVTLPDKQTFLLHHAFPRRPAEQNVRNVVLDEIVWKADGWPVINDYRGVSSEGSLPQ